MKASVNIQDVFLSKICRDAVPITVYLVNGFQLRGIVRGFDNFTILIVDSDGKQQMVYKHAISTFSLSRTISIVPEDKQVEEKKHEEKRQDDRRA